MDIFELMGEGGHEQLVFWSDPHIGYRGIIAIHDTTLGPALGGTRLWSYASERDAVVDALRLARGMTYKAAIAGLDLGGGKSVIMADPARGPGAPAPTAAGRDPTGGPRTGASPIDGPPDGGLPTAGPATGAHGRGLPPAHGVETQDREMIFRVHGRAVESLGGRYITAEDVGTGVDDMEWIRMETEHVVGVHGGSGDPSPVTAYGTYRGIRAAACMRYGDPSLEGKHVAVQGAGHVGYHLCQDLRAEGARVTVTDIDSERAQRVAEEFGATAVAPEEIYGVDAEIFAPCALGGVINDRTLEQFRFDIVAGSANNQLADPERHGRMVQERGILYAPDYVINAGGLINVYGELKGWNPARAKRKTGEIYTTLLRIFEHAAQEGIPTAQAADRIAEKRLQHAKHLQRSWVRYDRPRTKTHGA
jgi:leucine dehydrogenase